MKKIKNTMRLRNIGLVIAEEFFFLVQINLILKLYAGE